MKETIICANCGIEHPLDIMYQIEETGFAKIALSACYVRCDDCGRILRRDNARIGVTLSMPSATVLAIFF